jgi:hypothetical protein
MKIRCFLFPLSGLAALLAAGCSTSAPTASGPSPSYTSASDGSSAKNITVTFHDPERFTDCRSDFGSTTDNSYLDSLSAHVKRMAGPHVPADQKLDVTFTDIDLAGDFRPDRMQAMDVRIIKDIYRPRMALTFKLVGADGKVIKEGDRTLVDSYFMSNVNMIDRDEPLFYDKEMLSNWIRDEFKP